MDFFEVLERRKSVRRYLPENVGDEKISDMLEYVLLAPSAGNLQSYHIFVVRNEEIKQALADACFKQTFVSDAPVVFVVCADLESSASVYGRRGTLYALNDADIATTYLMLSASALGLASCWVGAFDEDAVRAILNLPRNLVPVSVLPVGVPAEDPPRPPRNKRPFTFI